VNKIIAIALSTALVAVASPSFAASVDLMQSYWIGR